MKPLTAVLLLLKRYWVLTVVLVALLGAVAVVSRLRTFFDSDKPYLAASQPADDIRPINTKRVTYEIVGPQNASGRVSYLDVNGRTVEAGFASLPWSVTVSTTDPGVLANVVAQGDSAELGCRILVDDRVVAEDHAEGRDALAFCLDKAA
ncbi:MAG: MmpS family transport accessory protein [Mycobacterium sp.]